MGRCCNKYKNCVKMKSEKPATESNNNNKENNYA